MAGTIGIKTADGNFYPILDENSHAKKRLVLTTAHDGQNSVQVDLFRSVSRSMLDAQYIGSLVVEDIKPRRKNEPSIEMLISADDDGSVVAEAYDLDAADDGERNVLNVSLKTIDTFTAPEDFPDFDADEDASTDAGSRGRKLERKGKFPWLLMLLIVLLVALGIGAAWFFLLGGRNFFPGLGAPATEQPGAPAEEPAPPLAPPPAVVQPPPPPPPPPSPPVIRAPTEPAAVPALADAAARPLSPLMLAHEVPDAIPPGGFLHQAREGDTLWDIAAAFYRNPLLYPLIAQHNDIGDPNEIAAGSYINIPPLD